VHQLGESENTLTSDTLARWKIFIVLGKFGQMLVADIQEPSALAHRPRALYTLAHRQLFVDRDHGSAKASLELLKELFYAAAHNTTLFRFSHGIDSES
jgi:hypothetical protein